MWGTTLVVQIEGARGSPNRIWLEQYTIYKRDETKFAIILYVPSAA